MPVPVPVPVPRCQTTRDLQDRPDVFTVGQEFAFNLERGMTDAFPGLSSESRHAHRDSVAPNRCFPVALFSVREDSFPGVQRFAALDPATLSRTQLPVSVGFAPAASLLVGQQGSRIELRRSVPGGERFGTSEVERARRRGAPRRSRYLLTYRGPAIRNDPQRFAFRARNRPTDPRSGNFPSMHRSRAKQQPIRYETPPYSFRSETPTDRAAQISSRFTRGASFLFLSTLSSLSSFPSAPALVR